MSIPLVDYHVHSTRSADAHSPMAGVCRRGVEIGLAEIAFTEHLDLQPDDPGYGFHDYAAYRSDLEACRERFDRHLTLRCAIEVSYQREFESEIQAYLDGKEFDFVLGSVHALDRQFVWLEEYYAGRTSQEVYLGYFEELRRAAATGWFDALGHFDLPKRYCSHLYGPFDPKLYAEAIDAVLEAAVESGTGLEINCSGLFQAPRETFPGLAVLKRYRERGGEIITVGSDAHRAEHLGKGLECAYDLARAAGFRAVATFHNRQPHFMDI